MRPTPEGTFPPEVFERLEEVGAWTREFGETVFATRGGPMAPQSWGVSTEKAGLVYVHVLDRDAPETLVLPRTAGLEVRSARLYGSGRDVPFRKTPDIEVRLPPRADRHPIDTILVLGVY